jgi:hypothetical protein
LAQRLLIEIEKKLVRNPKILFRTINSPQSLESSRCRFVATAKRCSRGPQTSHAPSSASILSASMQIAHILQHLIVAVTAVVLAQDVSERTNQEQEGMSSST